MASSYAFDSLSHARDRDECVKLGTIAERAIVVEDPADLAVVMHLWFSGHAVASVRIPRDLLVELSSDSAWPAVIANAERVRVLVFGVHEKKRMRQELGLGERRAAHERAHVTAFVNALQDRATQGRVAVSRQHALDSRTHAVSLLSGGGGDMLVAVRPLEGCASNTLYRLDGFLRSDDADAAIVPLVCKEAAAALEGMTRVVFGASREPGSVAAYIETVARGVFLHVDGDVTRETVADEEVLGERIYPLHLSEHAPAGGLEYRVHADEDASAGGAMANAYFVIVQRGGAGTLSPQALHVHFLSSRGHRLHSIEGVEVRDSHRLHLDAMRDDEDTGDVLREVLALLDTPDKCAVWARTDPDLSVCLEVLGVLHNRVVGLAVHPTIVSEGTHDGKPREWRSTVHTARPHGDFEPELRAHRLVTAAGDSHVPPQVLHMVGASGSGIVEVHRSTHHISVLSQTGVAPPKGEHIDRIVRFKGVSAVFAQNRRSGEKTVMLFPHRDGLLAGERHGTLEEALLSGAGRR